MYLASYKHYIDLYLHLSQPHISLIPRLSLSFLTFFACANIIREKLQERENLVRNPAHLWPPWPGQVIAAMYSVAHYAVLVLPCGS